MILRPRAVFYCKVFNSAALYVANIEVQSIQDLWTEWSAQAMCARGSLGGYHISGWASGSSGTFYRNSRGNKSLHRAAVVDSAC